MDTLNQTSLSTDGIVYELTPQQKRLNYIYDAYTSAYGIWFPYFFGLFVFIYILIVVCIFIKKPLGTNFITTKKDALIVKLLLGAILVIVLSITIFYGIAYRNLSTTYFPVALYKTVKDDRTWNILIYTIGPIFILIYIIFVLIEYKKAKYKDDL